MGPRVGRLTHPGPQGRPLTPLAAADALGRAYEATLDDAARARGAHYTPLDVAIALAERTLVAPGGAVRHGHPPTVWDPACGAGVFLLAAAEVLRRAGWSPAEIVTDLLWGSDTDPAAVAVAEAALVLWATEHGAPHARPGSHLVVADSLHHPPADGPVAHVLANPPFQGQLSGGSVRSRAEREALRRRWGPVVGPYTDTAALFLVAGVEALVPGGRLGMVLPTSVLSSRDAAGAREAVEARADLRGLWVAVDPVFDAAVDVCAPILERHSDRSPTREPPVVERWRGRAFEPLLAAAPAEGLGVDGRAGRLRPRPGWGAWGLAAHRVPVPSYRAGGTLADLATASAGFRDEYYGLVDHVVDLADLADLHDPPEACTCHVPDLQVGDRAVGGNFDGDLDESLDGLIDRTDRCPVHAPLVTTGLIDPGRCWWGERGVRFAKRTFQRPAVDLASLRRSAEGGGTAARALQWVTATARPKVVVATQTRVGEAAVDHLGRWVASTPVVAVLPTRQGPSRLGPAGVIEGEHDDRLWCLAAAVCSPVATLAALTSSFGSARSVHAFKLSAGGVLDLPLPVDHEAWLVGARALRDHDRPRFATAMSSAHGIGGPEATALEEWWADRAPW